MNFLMSRIRADRSIPGGICPQKNTIRVALVLRNVRANPCDNAPDVLSRPIPSKSAAAQSSAALHIHARHTVLQGPEHDVVVEGIAVLSGHALVTTASRYIDQHRSISAAFLGSEDIHNGSRVREVRDITNHRHTRIRLVLL